MEAPAKFRAISSICGLVIAMSVLAKWQLSTISQAKPNAPETVPNQVFKRVDTPPPKLPAPTFLKFTTVSLPVDGGADLADDGSILLLSFNFDTQTRTIRYAQPNGHFRVLPLADSSIRYSLSQSGRLFKFSIGNVPVGFPRRSGFRQTFADLAYFNYGMLGTPRRFLNNGAALSYEFDTNKVSKIYLYKPPAPKSLIKMSLDQLGIAEIDDQEGIWLYEIYSEDKEMRYRIHRSTPMSTTEYPVPNIIATPKLITTTKNQTVLTMRQRDPTPHHRAFRYTNEMWQEIFPPEGYGSVLIQRITKDGLMFGALQADDTIFVPVVWKDGKAYDLRRHPNWPVGGNQSYIQCVNRRGDLIVATTNGNGDLDESSTLLRRSGAK